MMHDSSTVKVTLEINQETNLEDLMAHLCMVKDTMPHQLAGPDSDVSLADFSIHEGELEPTRDNYLVS